MAEKTNSGLVKYAKAQVGKPYWYGTYGQTATAALLKSKKAQYPSYYTAADFESQIGKRVHDCNGLMKGYIWSASTTSTPVYDSSQDWSAKTLYSKAETKGKIATFDKVSGRLVFKGSTAATIHHVGVYSDGYVYEAKGHAYGVVKTKYTKSDWTFWAQDPRITDDTSTSTSTATSSSTSTSSSGSSSTSSSSTSKSSAPTYTVGKTYTLQVELNVRKGAGTSYAKVGYSSLTSDGKKHDKDKDGALDKGTVVTCKKVTKKSNGDIWIKCPSGWLAAYYNGNIYIK